MFALCLSQKPAHAVRFDVDAGSLRHWLESGHFGACFSFFNQSFFVARKIFADSLEVSRLRDVRLAATLVSGSYCPIASLHSLNKLSTESNCGLWVSAGVFIVEIALLSIRCPCWGAP